MDNQRAAPEVRASNHADRRRATGGARWPGSWSTASSVPLEGVPLHTNALDFLRGVRADRRQGGLRRGRVRRLRGHGRPARRRRVRRHRVDGDQLLPGAGRGLDGQEVVTAEGLGTPDRPAPGPARDGRARRVAVRLLHAGLRLLAWPRSSTGPAGRPTNGDRPPRRLPRRRTASTCTRSAATCAAAPATGRSGTPRSRSASRPPTTRSRPGARRPRRPPQPTRLHDGEAPSSSGRPTWPRRCSCCAAASPTRTVVAGQHRLGRRGQPPRLAGPALVVAIDRLPELRGSRASTRRRDRGSAPRSRSPRSSAGSTAAAAARRAVPAVRVAADPQRRHARRQPRHRLADRRRPAGAARARGAASCSAVGRAASGRCRWPTYFTGYRAVRPPRRRADHRGRRTRCRRPPLDRVPQDRQAAPSTTSPAWRSASRSTCATAGSRKARIGLGGVAATPIRALRHRGSARGPALDRGDRRRRGRGAGRRGHPDRRPAGQRRLPRGDARPVAAQAVRGPGHGRRSAASRRRGRSPSSAAQTPPRQRRRRRGAAARERGPARHRPGALHRRPGRPAPATCCTPTRCRRRTRTRGSPRSTPSAAYDVPGVVRVLTADDVPGVNDAGIKHDEPLFPDEVMYHGHAVCWVLGETLEAAPARSRDGRGRLRAAARADRRRSRRSRPRASRARSRTLRARRRRSRAGASAAHVFEGEFEFGGQEHFYLETHCCAGDGRRERPGLRPVQHPAPDRDPGDRRPRARPAQPPRSPCSACGWAAASAARRCSRTGSPRSPRSAPRSTGRPVRLRLTRQQDMTMTGKRHGFHATWRVGFDDDGRFTALEATLTSDGGWSLDLSEPVLVARAVPRRQRLLDPGRRACTAGSPRPTRPRRRRSAASAARRACS